MPDEGDQAAKSGVFKYLYGTPELGEGVWISPQAHVSGTVVLGNDVSVWPMAVIRGDVNSINIGERCNIQDGAVLHVSHEGPWTPDGAALRMGEDVTVGHAAVLHGCTVEDRCLIGMRSLVLDGAIVRTGSLVAAGAVVAPGTEIPSGTLWRGNPARLARELTEEEIGLLDYSAAHYVRLKNRYVKMAAKMASASPGEGKGSA
jgi:carbonic anhydrase/acetyltransferase-like protein (isoleucine patch superfamily)